MASSEIVHFAFQDVMRSYFLPNIIRQTSLHQNMVAEPRCSEPPSISTPCGAESRP